MLGWTVAAKMASAGMKGARHCLCMRLVIQALEVACLCACVLRFSKTPTLGLLMFSVVFFTGCLGYLGQVISEEEHISWFIDGVCPLFAHRPPGVSGVLCEQALEQTISMRLFPQDVAIGGCVKEILPRRCYAGVHMAARCLCSVHARRKIIKCRQHRRSHAVVSAWRCFIHSRVHLVLG